MMAPVMSVLLLLLCWAFCARSSAVAAAAHRTVPATPPGGNRRDRPDRRQPTTTDRTAAAGDTFDFVNGATPPPRVQGGSVKWRWQAPAPAPAPCDIDGAAPVQLSPDGATILAASGGLLAALNPVDGSVKWQLADRSSVDLLVHGDTVYGFSCSDREFNVTARNVVDGSAKWQQAFLVFGHGMVFADRETLFIWVYPTRTTGAGAYAVSTADGYLRWNQTLSFSGPCENDGDQRILASPDGAMVFLSCTDSNLSPRPAVSFALDTADGSVKWNRTHMSAVALSPSGDTIYAVGVGLGYYCALAAADGTIKWTFPYGASSSIAPAGPSSVVGVFVLLVLSPDGETVYVPSQGAALNSVDGSVKWQGLATCGDAGALSSDGATLFINSPPSSVRAVHTADGVIKWDLHTRVDAITDGWTWGNTLAVFGRASDSGDTRLEFETRDAGDGRVLWSTDWYPVDWDLPHGSFYSSDFNGSVVAVAAVDNTILWRRQLSQWSGGTGALSPDGATLYFASSAFSTTDGSVKWQQNNTGFAAVVSPDGVTLYAANTTHIIAMNTEDGSFKGQSTLCGSVSGEEERALLQPVFCPVRKSEGSTLLRFCVWVKGASVVGVACRLQHVLVLFLRLFVVVAVCPSSCCCCCHQTTRRSSRWQAVPVVSSDGAKLYVACYVSVFAVNTNDGSVTWQQVTCVDGTDAGRLSVWSAHAHPLADVGNSRTHSLAY